MSATPNHMLALAKANQVRVERARVRRELHAMPKPDALTYLADLLDVGMPEDPFVTWGIFDLLNTVRYLHRRTVLDLLALAGVTNPDLHLGNLTYRQCRVLAEALRVYRAGGAAALRVYEPPLRI